MSQLIEYPNDLFQMGSRFMEISGATICMNGKKELKRIQIESAKKKIKDYLKTHNILRISEISETLNLPPRIVGNAIDELEEEGLIKEVD